MASTATRRWASSISEATEKPAKLSASMSMDFYSFSDPVSRPKPCTRTAIALICCAVWSCRRRTKALNNPVLDSYLGQSYNASAALLVIQGFYTSPRVVTKYGWFRIQIYNWFSTFQAFYGINDIVRHIVILRISQSRLQCSSHVGLLIIQISGIFTQTFVYLTIVPINTSSFFNQNHECNQTYQF